MKFPNVLYNMYNININVFCGKDVDKIIICKLITPVD